MRADRLIALTLLLQRHRRLTAGDLAERLEVSTRTIFRDVEALSALGVPVWCDPGRGGGIQLMEGYRTDLTGLTKAECEAIALLSAPVVTGELGQRLQSALGKLAGAVPEAHRSRTREAHQRLLFDSRPWWGGAENPLLADLLDSVWRNRRIAFRYERLDGTGAEYQADAYALAAKVDVWYLVAETARGMRVFRVSRMEQLTVLDEPFQRRDDFDLPKFWQRWRERFESALPYQYPVRVRLTAEGRALVRARYGPWLTRFLEALPETEEAVILELDLERPDIAFNVLLTLGAEAEVLEPASLRVEIQAHAHRLLDLYAREDACRDG